MLQVRVVEAAQIISGPFAGAMMADQGAEVIKVELCNGVGDTFRLVGTHRGGVGSHFHNVNRGKKSVTLDTKTPKGQEVLIKLIETADVFIQNFRPGAAERMGIGEAKMRQLNPDLIYVSVSGFGATGPFSGRPCYDTVCIIHKTLQCFT